MSDTYSEFADYQGPDEPTVAHSAISLVAPEGQQVHSQLLRWSPGAQEIEAQETVGRPQLLLHPNPTVQLSQERKNDPAYRVLFVAISVVLLSSLVCIALLASAFYNSTTQKIPGGETNPRQVDSVHAITPTPTPISSAVLTATPTATSTSTPTPTTTPVATQSPVAEALTVHITNIPNSIQNNTTVPVNVTTSEPEVNVQLSITYYADGVPFATITQPQKTDSQGNVTILWNVQASALTTSAQITAIAQDQQDHQVTSSPVTVSITSGQSQ